MAEHRIRARPELPVVHRVRPFSRSSGEWNEVFETRAEARFDKIVCVACSKETQRVRLRERRWGDEQICQRLAAQMTVDEKIRRSDHVVWTDGPIEAQVAQWDSLLSSWDAVD